MAGSDGGSACEVGTGCTNWATTLTCCARISARTLAEEWTYRFLAAVHAWVLTEHTALQRISPNRVDLTELDRAPAAPKPSTAEVRAWACTVNLPVPDRGRLRPEIWQAWYDANRPNSPRSRNPSNYARDQIGKQPRSHETRCT